MLMAHGFLRRLFEVFERFKTPVDVVTTSEVSVSVTVDDTRRLDEIVDNLRDSPRSTSSARWRSLRGRRQSADRSDAVRPRASSALERIPLRMVSQAASRRNITFVLRDADVPDGDDAAARASSLDGVRITRQRPDGDRRAG